MTRAEQETQRAERARLVREWLLANEKVGCASYASRPDAPLPASVMRRVLAILERNGFVVSEPLKVALTMDQGAIIGGAAVRAYRLTPEGIYA